MAVRFDQLISLPQLKDLKLVGGSKGVFNTVRWVHVVETSEVISYVQNDELIILTGVIITDKEASFIELVNGLIEKKAAGLVVNIGKYIEKVPASIIQIAEENNFPVFELPWEVNLADLTQIICENIVKSHLEEISYQDLLMNIIFFNRITYEDFTERVSSHGYNSLNSYRILIVEIDRFQKYLETKEIKDEKDIILMKDTFLRSVNSAASEARWRPLSFLQNDSVVLLLINEKDRFINLTMLSEIIRESVKKSFPDISVNIGIGNIYTEFSRIKRSYTEAEKALKVLAAEGLSDGTRFYSGIGAYKLLTEIENIGLLKEYYDETVGRLEQYDVQNNTDFSKILRVFLQENGNYIQTAQKLYLHRNTLMYKINKIEEIIKRDLSDTQVRFEFYLGYLIKSIIQI